MDDSLLKFTKRKIKYNIITANNEKSPIFEYKVGVIFIGKLDLKYPLSLILSLSIILPKGSIIADIPVFAQRKTGNPCSTALNLEEVKC